MSMQKRWSKELESIKHKAPVQHHVFVDTESHWSQLDGNRSIVRHKLRFGYALHAESKGGSLVQRSDITFTTAEEFWEWLLSIRTKTRVWVWAHNIAFDGTMLGLWQRLMGDNCNLHHFTDCNLPAYFQCVIGEQSYQFIDSLNIFRQSLASIGEQLGFPKMTMPEQSAGMGEWLPYCQRDVHILHRIIDQWCKFIDEHKLGEMKPSLASQSLAAYRCRFLTHPIHLHCNEHVTKLERAAYTGGLVEPKFIGKVPADKVYEYDINSLYPFVMRDNLFPCLLMGFERWPAKKRMKELLGKYYVIAHVRLRSTTGVMPVKHNGRLMFPLGNYWTTLHKPELERAYKLGLVDGVGFVAWYAQSPLFKSYVDYFYARRQEYKAVGDGTFEYLCKIFMNSLYGKFGQKRPSWEPYSEELLAKMELKGVLPGGELSLLKEHIECADPTELKFRHPLNDELYGARWLMGQAQLLTGEGESPHSFPAIAGAVTSYAREYVRNIQAGIPKHCLFYTDTDSFFVNDKGRKALEERRLIDDIKLGKLKAKTVNDWMVVYGPKDYETNNEVKRKGVRSSAKQVGKKGDTFIQEQWPGFKTLAKQGFIDVVDVKLIRKQLKRKIITLNVSSDGWTYPIYLDIDNYIMF